jgi:hypothetical protein
MATAQELADAKREAELRKVRRSVMFEATNAWIWFGISKLAGLAGVVIGGLALFEPEHLPSQLPHIAPLNWLFGGVALLSGKAIARKAADFFEGS